jgi:two-component system, OmpR family, sensor histidine kinase CpxA
MGSLFVRIFLSFWIAAVLLIVTVAVVTNLTIDSEGLQLQRERQVQVETLAAAAAEVVGSATPEQLRRQIGNWGRRMGAHLILLDDRGDVIVASRPRLRSPRVPAPEPAPPAPGQPAPAAQPPLAPLPDRPPAEERDGRPAPQRIEAPFTGIDGVSYTLIAMFPPIDPAAQPDRRGLNLLLALIVSGLISYLLARYLANPLRAVREAASGLARGDLSARVGGDATRRSDEMGQLARDFDHMAERLEALVHDQQRLVRDVSHELRSPLARLQVALGLAHQRGGDTVGPELARIEREAEGLDRIIGELLLLSRLQAEQTGERSEVDLLALCSKVADDVAFEGTARGCEVIATGAAASTHGDMQLIARAIENVARNALRYSPDGGTVELEVKTHASGITVSVCDQGPGVPEAELDRIFEPFYRVSETREHEGGTGGIGLAIAQRAAAAHGGSIQARNRATGGLCVEIRLPS